MKYSLNILLIFLSVLILTANISSKSLTNPTITKITKEAKNTAINKNEVKSLPKEDISLEQLHKMHFEGIAKNAGNPNDFYKAFSKKHPEFTKINAKRDNQELVQFSFHPSSGNEHSYRKEEVKEFEKISKILESKTKLNDDYEDLTDTPVPLYRYWHPQAYDHFYTTNPSEIGTTTPNKIGNYGYYSEGIALRCMPNIPDDNVRCLFHTYPNNKHEHCGTVPLHRYWRAASADHFYTTYESEIGTTVPGKLGNYDYRYEGIQCYVYLAPEPSRPGLVPLYRYWNPVVADHFYTLNSAEIGTLVVGKTGNYGYIYEGIQCYVFPA